MHFETLQAISLNGQIDKPNDDRCGNTARVAWVIDGATDMGAPGLLGWQGGAAWLSSTASAAFAMPPKENMRATCEAVFDRIEAQFDLDSTREIKAAWEVPKAAFGAVQLGAGQLSVAWAADCPVLKISDDEVVWCTGEPDTSAEAEDALKLGAGVGAAKVLSGAVLEDRRAHRARHEHQALSSNAAASAAVAQYGELPVKDGDELLLMSDGFASLVTDYDAYSAEGLAAAVRSKGLSALAQEVRVIEEEDAACLRFPRFKVSDDATALWLRVVGS